LLAVARVHIHARGSVELAGPARAAWPREVRCGAALRRWRGGPPIPAGVARRPPLPPKVIFTGGSCGSVSEDGATCRRLPAPKDIFSSKGRNFRFVPLLIWTPTTCSTAAACAWPILANATLFRFIENVLQSAAHPAVCCNTSTCTSCTSEPIHRFNWTSHPDDGFSYSWLIPADWTHAALYML
jgi:hypothetical protein